MKYFNDNIFYLQRKDFDNNGKLINNRIDNEKLIMIMIQANFCGYCTMAKPDYKKFADANKDIVCMTIQADGDEEGEKELSKILKNIDSSFRGFPHYVVYRGGNRIGTYEGDRSLKSLNEYISKIKNKI